MLVAALQQYVPANTLGELLRANGVTNTGSIPESTLQMFIANGNQTYYSAYRDSHQFIFAGRLLPKLPGPGVEIQDDRIHVVWADTDTQNAQLKYAAVSGQVSNGSIWDVRPGKNYAYVGVHLSPSAIDTLVLTRDLKLQRELDGWPTEILENDVVIFINGMVHFAPTHPEGLSAYDPNSNVEKKIYPPAKVDAIRSDFVNRVRAAYDLRGKDWFEANNHHMDPRAFDSSVGPLVSDHRFHTIAFLVTYSNPINDAHDPKTEREDVVATCVNTDRVEQIVCKERSLDSWVDELKVERDPILASNTEKNTVALNFLARVAVNPDLVP